MSGVLRCTSQNSSPEGVAPIRDTCLPKFLKKSQQGIFLHLKSQSVQLQIRLNVNNTNSTTYPTFMNHNHFSVGIFVKARIKAV